MEENETNDDDNGYSSGELKIIVEDDLDEKKTKTRRRKRMSKTSESSDEEIESLPNNCLAVEEKVCTTAAKINLTAANVKNILKRVVTNEHVLALVKLREEELENGETSEVSPSPKITRSKVKKMKFQPGMPWPLPITPVKAPQIKVSSPEVTKLIDQDLPDEESGDEEYHPNPDEASDDERDTISSISDADSQPRTPATPGSTFVEETLETVPTKWTDDGLFKIPNPVTIEEEKATIALRTRSKLCLNDMAIEAIEQSFVPPDDDVDDYQIDNVWTEFLSEFTNPISPTEPTNEDDDEADPEYNAAADNEKDDEELRDEEEDLEVTRKEFNDLVAELFDMDGTLDFHEAIMEPSAPNSGLIAIEVPPMEQIDTILDNSSPIKLLDISKSIPYKECNNHEVPHVMQINDDVVMQNCDAVNESELENTNLMEPNSIKIEIPEKPKNVVSSSVEYISSITIEVNDVKAEITNESPKNCIINEWTYKDGDGVLTRMQREIFDQQMRQHVQLLTQNYLQVYAHPNFWQYAPKQKEFLMTLKYLANDNPHSAFAPCNLFPAIELCERWEQNLNQDTEENRLMIEFISKEILKEQDRRKHNTFYAMKFPKEFTQCLLESNVFLYPNLIPHIPYRTFEKTKLPFVPSENELIAIGLEEFTKYMIANPSIYSGNSKNILSSTKNKRGVAELICQFLIPFRKPKRIVRYICDMNKECAPKDNPIKYFFQHNKAPKTLHSIELYDPTKKLKEHHITLFPPSWQQFVMIYCNTQRIQEEEFATSIINNPVLQNLPVTDINGTIINAPNTNFLNSVPQVNTSRNNTSDVVYLTPININTLDHVKFGNGINNPIVLKVVRENHSALEGDITPIVSNNGFTSTPISVAYKPRTRLSKKNDSFPNSTKKSLNIYRDKIRNLSLNGNRNTFNNKNQPRSFHLDTSSDSESSCVENLTKRTVSSESCLLPRGGRTRVLRSASSEESSDSGRSVDSWSNVKSRSKKRKRKLNFCPCVSNQKNLQDKELLPKNQTLLTQFFKKNPTKSIETSRKESYCNENSAGIENSEWEQYETDCVRTLLSKLKCLLIINKKRKLLIDNYGQERLRSRLKSSLGRKVKATLVSEIHKLEMLPSMPYLSTPSKSNFDALENENQMGEMAQVQSDATKDPIIGQQDTPVQIGKKCEEKGSGHGRNANRTGPPNHTTKHRLAARAQRELEANKAMFANSDPYADDLKDTVFATAYFEKVQSRLTNNLDPLSADFTQFNEFQNILSTFDAENETPCDLYYKLEKLFGKENEDLTEEFLTFLSAGQAVQIGRFMDHFVLTNMTNFIERLQKFFARRPAQLRKVLWCLEQIVENMDHSTDAVSMESIKSTIVPLLKGNTYLINWFLRLFPTEKPQESFINSGYEILDIESMTKETTTEESVIPDVLSYEVINIPNIEDNYGNDSCTCDCHKTADEKYRSRSRHCIPCGMKYMQGRIYIQHGKGLRAARVTWDGRNGQSRRLSVPPQPRIPHSASSNNSSGKRRAASLEPSHLQVRSADSEDERVSPKRSVKCLRTPTSKTKFTKAMQLSKKPSDSEEIPVRPSCSKSIIKEEKSLPVCNDSNNLEKLADALPETEEELHETTKTTDTNNTLPSLMDDSPRPDEHNIIDNDLPIIRNDSTDINEEIIICNTSSIKEEIANLPDEHMDIEVPVVEEEEHCQKETTIKMEEEVVWTRDEDKAILLVLQSETDMEYTFEKIQRLMPHRSIGEIRDRFQNVMQLLQQMASDSH